jgi:hypothetical protein
MDQETIEILKEFGLALVEREHQFFEDESIDNAEYVSAIQRIADATYEYLITKGISTEMSRKVRNELINHGRELFIKTWMIPLDEDEEPPDEKEARRTFNQLLKKRKETG